MKIKYFPLFFLCALIGLGCAHKDRYKALKEEEAALKDVTEALSGRNISREELRAIAQEMQTNAETKSAVESIGNSFQMQNFDVKYCPVDGERFSATLEVCPRHGARLKNVSE